MRYPTGGGYFTALDGVNLAVEEGEFVAVMGPSGSGKSTLLSILGALNPPSRGRVVVDGIDVYGLSAERRADFRSAYLGFAFQQGQLISFLSALENVMLPLAILRHSHKEQLARAESVLARVGLEGKMTRLPDQLSGGEQARVAIARAIVNEPPVVLADEPTGALDSRTGEEILGVFHDLNRSGLTVIMVTHNTETLRFARRVVRLRDGRLVEEE